MEIETGRDRAAERRARSPAARAATWLVSSLVRLEPRIEAALGTRAWVPLSVLVALLVAAASSTPGFGTGSAAYERRARLGWAPAVQMKIDDPLLDMAPTFSQWSNQAKRTFRITAPAVAYLTFTGIAGAVVFEYLCAYAALHCAALLGFRLLGTRSAGFFATLMLASTYFGTAVFKDAFFWFDSVAYGLLLLAMTASSPGLRGLAVCAACFSDERALLVLPLTFVRWGGGAAGRAALRHDALATMAGAGAYLTARAVLSYALQLPTSTAGIGTGVLLVSHVYQLVLCLWAPFEGAWLLIGVGAALLLREAWSGRRIAAAGFLYWAAYVAACFLVLDSTRSMSYALVGVFPLLKAMTLRLEPARVRALLALAALVSLLVPNLFVWHDLSYEIGFLSRLYPGT